MADFELNPNIDMEVLRAITPTFAKIKVMGTEIAQQEVPVDKGDLQSTINGELNNPGVPGMDIVISAGGEALIAKRGRDYSHFVEFNNKSFLRAALFRLAMKMRGGIA